MCVVHDERQRAHFSRIADKLVRSERHKKRIRRGVTRDPECRLERTPLRRREQLHRAKDGPQQLMHPREGKLRFGLHADRDQCARPQLGSAIARTLEQRRFSDARLSIDQKGSAARANALDQRIQLLELRLPSDQILLGAGPARRARDPRVRRIWIRSRLTQASGPGPGRECGANFRRRSCLVGGRRGHLTQPFGGPKPVRFVAQVAVRPG
jgi:hypothetical protein